MQLCTTLAAAVGFSEPAGLGWRVPLFVFTGIMSFLFALSFGLMRATARTDRPQSRPGSDPWP